MTAINNKNIISNKIVTFLSSSDISVVFIYLFSHANTNLLKRRFLYEQFLNISVFVEFTYLARLAITQTRIPHISSLLVLQSSNTLHSHTGIHHDLIFALNYIHFHLIHIYTHTAHVELKILFNLHWTLNTFAFIFFKLFEAHTRAYGSSIV